MNTVHIRSRNYGTYNAMVSQIISLLEEGREISVYGCQEPEGIISRVKLFNLEAVAEPIYKKTEQDGIFVKVLDKPILQGYKFRLAQN
ncbi:MAG: hypothetical protein AB3N18_00640 [Allomuricauda sp.]